MRVVARLGWEDLAWGTPLARALAAGALAAPLRPPDLPREPRDATGPDIAPALIDALQGEMDPAQAAAWRRLREPGARAIVTGQQPGCAGGALLVLYKAATAVALSRRAERRLARAVVPIFWNATDDEDFEEIARVAWPLSGGGLAFLELPGAGRRAAGWVGDLPAEGDAVAARTVLDLLSEPERAALGAVLPETAPDHGSWVGSWLGRVFPELAVLDARSPALRRHGAALFSRYLDRHEPVQRAAEAGARALEAAGYAPTLASGSARGALYVTHGRRRQKPGDDLEPLRRALETAPEQLSPNVVLRPLLQDALLPTLAHVVGAAEIGYLLELRPLRRLLEVAEPALVPRLTATLLEPEAWETARGLGVEPGALVLDPETALRRAGRTAAPGADLAAAFAAVHERLERLPLGASARARAARRLSRVQEEIVSDLDSAAGAALQARHPALAGLASLVRPRGRPQERIVAGLWLLSRGARAAHDALLALAESHLDALDACRAEHLLVTL